MQGIELRHAFVIETDHLGIENGNALDARRFLDDARVAVSPVGPVHRIETHPPIAEMDLQPIAVMLSSCAQPGPCGVFLATVGRHGWMKAAGTLLVRREVRIRHNMHDLAAPIKMTPPECARKLGGGRSLRPN